MPLYAELVLPLPLAQRFTYRLNDEQAKTVSVGMRAVVSFGKQHYYTGIIVSISPKMVGDFEVKDIESLMDDHAIIRHPQYAFWQWIAHYYMCSEGEVMKAALPSGLKLESETSIVLNTEYEEHPDERLSEREISVLSLLGEKAISIGTLEKTLQRSSLLNTIRQLLRKEAIFIHEDIRQTYKPKVAHFVRLALPPWDNEQQNGERNNTLETLFEQLKRSPRQQALFMKLLDLSQYLRQPKPIDIAQQTLLQQAGCSSNILHELQRKGLVEIYTAEVRRSDTDTLEPCIPPHPLSKAQQTTLQQICTCFSQHQVTLLHGVTSSGKTEVYMHLMQEIIGQRRQVLMMVPEIALTTQLCNRLRRVFGRRMVVYHSKLSDNQRVEIWQRMLGNEQIDIVLGVRSSIFLPFRQLGLIIVDEEHEPSYKQQDPAPRYHGRDAAIMLAQRHAAKVLLGSATPSLESYYLATHGKYGFVQLLERYAGVSLPNISLVSMLEAKRNGQLNGVFSNTLLQHINHTLQAGKQCILFQNRRGYAHQIECPACAWTPRCPRCDVSLVYHKRTRNLQCHYCGFQQPWPATCPSCGNHNFNQQGYGTERIEDALTHLIPIAKVSRMDTDTTSSRRSYERIIGDFEANRTNVLIGTQMVSKGLDFDQVHTVGIIHADAMMNMPDFRSHERAFQLMEQVSGRAGRRQGQEGEVLIQCSNPQHPLLKQVVNHDYIDMAATQLKDREEYHYPPFTRLIVIYMKGRYEDRLDVLANTYANRLRQTFGERVFGPDAPGIARIKNFYIRKIMLKIEREASTQLTRSYLLDIQHAMQQHKDFARIMFYYDVDPI